MDPDIRDLGKMERCMAKVYFFGKMDRVIVEDISMVKNMVLGLSIMFRKSVIRENGRMENKMVGACYLTEMDKKSKKAYGKIMYSLIKRIIKNEWKKE